jgi:hypothetical protein
MSTITNPTPEQTATSVAGEAAVSLMSDKQVKAIGLAIQAISAEADTWHLSTDNFELILSRRVPAIVVWPADRDADPRCLAIGFDADGDMRLFDYDGPSGGAWRRVAGSDITGIIGAAWRREFGA